MCIRDRVIIKIKPPIDVKEGETRIPFEMVNGYGLVAGYGNVSVNIPQYYGVSIVAQQIDSNVKILVTNTGNGKDSFKLTNTLEEGLTLYLTETYFELEAYETKEINSQGLKTEVAKTYDAYFEVESIGNDNISANIFLEIKGTSDSQSNDDFYLNTLSIIVIGALVFSIFFIRIRRT